MKNFSLSQSEKEQLIKIARETLESYVIKGEIPEIQKKDLSEALQTKAGAFVTLNKDENLRGCIGRFIVNEPLYKVIQEMAIAAATEDSRFSKVTCSDVHVIYSFLKVTSPDVHVIYYLLQEI